MSVEETNKDIIRRILEGTLITEDVLPPDFVDHNAGSGCQGSEHCDYWKQTNKEFRTAFPDAKATINHIIAEGDLVAVDSTTTCTHTGMFRGKPPTGKQLTWTAISIYRIVDGKIAENWDCIGLHRDLEQLLEP